MIIIRESFIAKPGNASKLAKMMKEVMQEYGQGNVKIMTDMTGEFNQVVMETEVENFMDMERRMKEYMDNQEMRDKMSSYRDMYLTGKREIYQIW